MLSSSAVNWPTLEASPDSLTFFLEVGPAVTAARRL